MTDVHTDRELAGGPPTPQQVHEDRSDVRRSGAPAEWLPGGQFRATVDDDVWWWSTGLHTLLGHGQVTPVPTTALLLHHVDRPHREDVRSLLLEASTGIQGLQIRIRTPDDRVRTVVLTAGPDLGVVGRQRPSWMACSITGAIVDVTDAERHSVTRAVQAANQHRTVVDQAKGMVMMVFQLSDEAAFLLMSYFAQSRGIRLHEVASDLVEHPPVLAGDCRRMTERVLAGDLGR